MKYLEVLSSTLKCQDWQLRVFTKNSNIKSKVQIPNLTTFYVHSLRLVEQILSSHNLVNVYVLDVCSGPFRTRVSCNVRYIFILSRKCRAGTIQWHPEPEIIEENETYPQIYPRFWFVYCVPFNDN